MNYYFITGTSRGIGKAIAELLLKKEDNYVIGISRNNVIKHNRYEHIVIDLSNLDHVKNFQFIKIIDAKSVVLINNAGILGDVKHLGTLSNNLIEKTYVINTISPSILMNNFIKAYQSLAIKKLIINISSGAGRHSIESWSAYCASKAAMDMFSKVAAEDMHVESHNMPFYIFSVAPGIVDTSMQDEIRKVDEKNFSKVKTFINYKNKQELSSPGKAAILLNKIIQNPDRFDEIILDLRNLPLS